MRKKEIVDKDILSNREKALAPRKTKFYCEYCDRSFVGPGAKCPVCNKRSGKRRLKK